MSSTYAGTCQLIQQLLDGERALATQTENALQKALARIQELEESKSVVVAEE